MGRAESLQPHGRTWPDPKKLIEAAAYSARYGDPAPEDLQLYWLCERFDALPEPGAMYDQDAFLMMRMTHLDNIHSVVARLGRLKGAQIHSLTDHERRIIRALLDMGVIL